MGLIHMAHLDVVVKLEMDLGESPLWDYRQQCLYWIDIHVGRIYAWKPSVDKQPVCIQLNEPVGCLALSEQHHVIAAMKSGICQLDAELQPAFVLAKNPEWDGEKGNRFNDGCVDPLKRLWVGTLDREEKHSTAALYCLSGTELEKKKSGITISNGIAFSPAGDWLYHTDSPKRQVVRHRFNPQTGEIGEAELWINLDTYNLPGVVDGAAVDSLGRYWCALYGGGQVVCFSPEGEYLHSYLLPCPHPTMVTFGGDDLKTMFVTTARQHLTSEEYSLYPDAGSLFACQVDVPGLAQPIFKGSIS